MNVISGNYHSPSFLPSSLLNEKNETKKISEKRSLCFGPTSHKKKNKKKKRKRKKEERVPKAIPKIEPTHVSNLAVTCSRIVKERGCAQCPGAGTQPPVDPFQRSDCCPLRAATTKIELPASSPRPGPASTLSSPSSWGSPSARRIPCPCQYRGRCRREGMAPVVRLL